MCTFDDQAAYCLTLSELAKFSSKKEMCPRDLLRTVTFNLAVRK